MGLDMFMYSRKKFRENDPEYNKLVKENRKEVAYWRKANQIRGWIIEHTDYKCSDNCEIVEISKETLEQLLADCKKIKANPNCGPEIMPVTGGFFFGTYEYDGLYMGKIDETIRQVEDILLNTDFDKEVIEYSDWW